MQRNVRIPSFCCCNCKHFWKFLEMLVDGTDWQTRRSLVRKRSCSSSHDMDKSLWQTLSSFIACVHHTNDQRQYGHVGNTAQHCRMGLFRFCWRPWRLQINLRVNLLYFRKSNICSHDLDVPEANISVSQFYRIRDKITGCWFAKGRYSCSWLVESVTLI